MILSSVRTKKKIMLSLIHSTVCSSYLNIVHKVHFYANHRELCLYTMLEVMMKHWIWIKLLKEC